MHMRFAFIHRKENLEIVLVAIGGRILRKRISLSIHRLGQSVGLGITGGTEYRHANVLDARGVGKIANCPGAVGLEQRNLRLHRDGHETGGLDVLPGLDGLKLRLVAGNQAKQER